MIINRAGKLNENSITQGAVSDSLTGRFRRELFWTLGEKRLHGILARVGFSFGQTDTDHSEGTNAGLLVKDEISQEMSPGGIERFVLETDCSLEANNHIKFFDTTSHKPQCWLLAGYLTGQLSQQKKEPLYFIETHCRAKKDPLCRFIGQRRADWEEETVVDLSYYLEDNLDSELAQTHELLQMTRDRYQNLFEQSSLAVLIIDPQTGVMLDSNFAGSELTGFSRDELINMTIFDLCHKQDHNRLMMEMKSLLAENKLGEREITIVRDDGLLRVIAHNSKILSYGGRRVMQSIMRDITDLKTSAQKEKDLQHQLLRSERLSSIGRLAAGVAHELKNPLGAIRNAVYYVRGALKDNPLLETDPHLKEVMKMAEEEIDISVVIIGELLDFSRVVQLAPRKTLINELVEKLPIIINIPENIELKYDLDPTLPSAMLDPDRLTQVFTNIASNAAQAMPNGGKLIIKSRMIIETSDEQGVNRELLVVSFEDFGTGIEPIHISKIFEPLFTTKTRGTGLGLAISRNIIEKHGGVILVNSQVGKGTCFTIKLPLQPPTDEEDKNYEQRTNIIG